MSISTQGIFQEYIFEYIFWTVNHMNVVVGNVIANIFAWLGGLGIKLRPFSIY